MCAHARTRGRRAGGGCGLERAQAAGPARLAALSSPRLPGPSPPPRAAHRQPADPAARARALVRASRRRAPVSQRHERRRRQRRRRGVYRLAEEIASREEVEALCECGRAGAAGRPAGRAGGGCPAASGVGARREAGRGEPGPRGLRGRERRGASAAPRTCHRCAAEGRGAGRGRGRRPPPRELPAGPKFVAIVQGEPESKRPGLKGPSHPEPEGRLRGRAAPGPQRASEAPRPSPGPFLCPPLPGGRLLPSSPRPLHHGQRQRHVQRLY